MTTIQITTLESISVPTGFTYGLFTSINECEDFIWGYLFDKGAQYHKPLIIGSKTVLIYENI